MVAAANEFGYKSGPFAKTGATPAFKATGIEQHFPDGTDGPINIVSTFAATSGVAGKVEAVTFTFDMRQTGPLDRKRDRDVLKIPGRVIEGFLNRFEVYPDDAIKGAVAGATSTTKIQSIAKLAVVSTPIKEGIKSALVTVTITPAGAAAPTQPQDKAARN